MAARDKDVQTHNEALPSPNCLASHELEFNILGRSVPWVNLLTSKYNGVNQVTTSKPIPLRSPRICNALLTSHAHTEIRSCTGISEVL